MKAGLVFVGVLLLELPLQPATSMTRDAMTASFLTVRVSVRPPNRHENDGNLLGGCFSRVRGSNDVPGALPERLASSASYFCYQKLVAARMFHAQRANLARAARASREKTELGTPALVADDLAEPLAELLLLVGDRGRLLGLLGLRGGRTSVLRRE